MKFKKLYKNITKYVFVGGAAALIDWLIFWILAIRLDLFLSTQLRFHLLLQLLRTIWDKYHSYQKVA